MDLLIIIGMHRSGTSLCARICQELGIYLGEELLPGKPDNPDGYFESRAILQIHCDIAAALGPGWELERSIQPMPQNWWLAPEVRPALDGMRQWISTIRKQSDGRVPGFKDPRTARLLPAWNYVLEEMGLKPAYLLCLRYPMSVIQSLAKRNAIFPAHSELMWLQHTVGALTHCRRGPAMILSYERWFTDFDAQFAQLSRFFNIYAGTTLRAAGDAADSIRRIIDPEKDHSSSRPFYPAFPNTLVIYDALVRGCGTDSLTPALWESVREFTAGEGSLIEKLERWSRQGATCNSEKKSLA